jgi:tRNA-specific 2-thiouridylase
VDEPKRVVDEPKRVVDEPKRVVVAMSGGVDSSVAAALLVDQGYEVIGLMMRLWSEPGNGPLTPTNRCCTLEQVNDARRVADILGIPFYVIDVRDQFRRSIVQFFIDEHAAGRTPNPCVECNRQIRFTNLLERAMSLGADYLATGHYARVEQSGGIYRLRQGIDPQKDQSYVLHVLQQSHLARVLFPVGELTKAESQDLCFLNDGDYRRFLREHSARPPQPGPILDAAGRELGRHEGLPFYTIGQRKGLGLAAAEPLFVLRKDAGRNALVVGPREALGAPALVARGVNWIAGEPPAAPAPFQVKIRYKAAPANAVVTSLPDGKAHVAFDLPAVGATPGQAAVFYDGDLCLGGGTISHVEAPLIIEEKVSTEAMPA